MSHSRKGSKFGRERDQRRAFFESLARSVILKERVTTTEARAKAIRPIVEKLITKARTNDLATRRHILSQFHNQTDIAKKLLDDLGPRYKDRSGGYTRITKVEGTPGSGRRVAVIEFV